MAPLQTGAMNVTSLHIALVSETFPPEVNGVANTLGRLCQGLRERGHRLQLVRPRQADDTAPNDDQLLLTRGWPLPGYAASHGCIRMHDQMARHFFANVAVGTPVAVE